MATYIDKEKLPQFQYYNFCEGEYAHWDMDKESPSAARPLIVDGKPTGTYDYVENPKDPLFTGVACDDLMSLMEMAEDKSIAGRTNMAKYQEGLRAEWFKEWENKKGPCYQYLLFVSILGEAMFKDRATIQKWSERLHQATADIKQTDRVNLIKFLAMADEATSFAALLRTCQGFPLDSNGRNLFPKMLLVDADFYKEQRNRDDIHLDYHTIKNALKDTCYVITVNGDTPDKKMCFCMVPHLDHVALSMLDPVNGLSTFFLYPETAENKGPQKAMRSLKALYGDEIEEGAVITREICQCHPRGDYNCWSDGPAGGGDCGYCNGKHNCKHKSMNIAAAIFYCFQEYARKLASAKTKPSPGTAAATAPSENKTKRFIPSGMIKLYDIKYSAEELERVNKYASFKGRSQYTSTEKSPHVRRGTMRFNPKTGEKDIVVRGSIIHKDRYEGFSSADRIKK